MLNSAGIKRIALDLGADLCGVAPVERFHGAPEGFKPQDIYPKCKSVLVFAKQVPAETLQAASCIPYTQVNSVVMQAVDQLAYQLSLALQAQNIGNVMVPTDDPYEHWDAENQYGRAILSLRHAGLMAGLGYLGRNTLLINPQFGNMIQIGALLLDLEDAGDPLLDLKCPEDCDLCLSHCPAGALDGITVDQKKCRPLSVYKHAKGYVLKKCYQCRKVCPRTRGIHSPNLEK